VDCLIARVDGMALADDEAILARATELGRVVLTQDTDFLGIAKAWLEAGREFAGVVYAPQMGVTIGGAILDVELIAGALGPSEMVNVIQRIPIR
jgi:hypothetical protein